MPLVQIKQFDGSAFALEVPFGTSVMRAAVDAQVNGIIGECGGAAMCGTCHVYVDPAWRDRLPAMSQNEDDLLDCTAAERRSNSRLSCQLKMSAQLEGLALQLPECQR